MRRILTMGIVALFAGLALAGCTGGNTGDGGTGGAGGGQTAAPQAVVTASPLSPKVNEQVSFRAAQAGATDTASWNFGDGETATGAQVTHAYTSAGQYIVTLEVKTSDGKTANNDAALTYITVTGAALESENITAETAPVATAAASAQVIQTGGTVNFDATGSGAWVENPDFDPAHVIDGPNQPFTSTGDVTYAWDFGDGGTGTGQTANHTYATAGVFPAKLTVTSTGGQSSSYVITVRVLPTLPPSTGVRNPTTFLTATIGEPESLDPAYDYETSGGTILQHVYETLYFYRRDAADILDPRLAIAMPTVENDVEYTIKLRPNVKFHDGNVMSAEDVKFSIDRLILMNDPDGPAWIYASIKGADHYMHTDGTAADRKEYLDAGGVTIVDPMTVKITLDHPDPAFTYKLAFNAASVVSKKGVCANAEADFVDCLPPPGETRHAWMDRHEVGSGPFQLDAWIPGQQVILKRYADYWGTKPALEKVIFQKVEDINTRLLMLFSGQADDVYIPVDHDVDVIGKPNIRIVENPSWTVGFIGFNQKFCGGPNHKNFQSCMTTHGSDAPKGADGQTDVLFFSDINMRKAWSYAFDYDTYYNDILKGHGRMLNGPLPKGIFGYDESIPAMKRDMAKAKEAFAKTNHSNGFTITVYYNSGNTVRESTANLLAQNIEELAPGKIDVKVQGLDWSTAFLPKQRAFGMPTFYLGWAPDYAYPDNYVVTFAHSTQGVYSKRVGYSNPALDEKLDGLLRELDETKAKQGWSEAVKTLNDDFVFLWLAQSANYHVERDWVRGYYYNPMHSGGPQIGDYTAISKG